MLRSSPSYNVRAAAACEPQTAGSVFLRLLTMIGGVSPPHGGLPRGFAAKLPLAAQKRIASGGEGHARLEPGARHLCTRTLAPAWRGDWTATGVSVAPRI